MYPRVGRPLVPRLLVPTLERWPIPGLFIDELGAEPGTHIVDLDESIWRDHDRALIEALAGHAVRALDPAVIDEVVGDVQVFVERPPVDALDIALRVENALRRAGLVRDGRLVPILIRDLMQVSTFGVKSLLDVLTAVEAAECDARNAGHEEDPPPSRAKASPAVKKAAKGLSRKRWATRVSPRDPRVSSILGPLPVEAPTIREAADWIAEQEYTPSEARSMVGRLRRAETELDALRHMSLAGELRSVLEAVSGKQSDAALVARLGFSGSEPVTLEQAGDLVGLTRERVRQLEKKFRDAVLARGETWTPVLDAAIEVTREALPTTPEELQERLAAAGLIDAPFSVHSLLTACRVFDKEIPVEPTEALLVDRTLVDLVSAARSAALRLVEHWGASTLPDVQSRLADAGLAPDAETVRLAVESMEQFSWLDDVRRWFWIAGTRNRLLNQVEKIMSVAGSIGLNDLRRGVGRHHRMKGFRPPREVLAQLCVQSGLYRRRGDVILGVDPPDWRELLGRNERVLVETLFDHGPIMRRDDLIQMAVDERGLKRNSVGIYLGYSPVIERFAPGVYGLRGARVGAAEVEALIPPRVRHQVLQDHGWTDDGFLWMAFRLSPASAESGVLGTPAAVRAVAEGSYPLFNDGGDPVGTLVVEYSIWGLSPYFHRWGVEAGDYVLLVLKTRDRTATVSAGTEELLLKFQAGD